MFLTSNTQTSELLSNSGALPGAIYRTIDKVVQEDAFRLETNGREKAGISFSSSFREDLSFELEQKSALVMTLMRDSDISGAVNIAMNCESEGDVAGSCRAEVDIQQQLKIKKALDSSSLLNPGKVYPILRKCAEEGRVHVHRGKTKFANIPRF
jgi:hypothetical protein